MPVSADVCVSIGSESVCDCACERASKCVGVLVWLGERAWLRVRAVIQ